MPYKMQPWGTTPASPVPAPDVPPHVRKTHVTLPKDKLRRAGIVVASIALSLGLLGTGYEIGHHHHVVPIPGPIPPNPEPPKPSGPLRVLVVYDPAMTHSRGQDAVLHSTAVRAWLSEHCSKDSTSRAAWRFWPTDVKADGEPEDWRRAWATAKPLTDKLPAVVIFHGERAKSFPLPESDAATIELLTREGGK